MTDRTVNSIGQLKGQNSRHDRTFGMTEDRKVDRIGKSQDRPVNRKGQSKGQDSQ